MSKSKGNAINPDEVSKKYGMDTARFFLFSLAAPYKSRDWSEKGIEGSLRFIKRIIKYFDSVKIGKIDNKTESKLNKSIKEITKQIESFNYNLATIRIRNLFDSLPKETSKRTLEDFLKILHPFCPHITEELWEKIKGKGFVSLASWPKFDEKKIDENLEKEEEAIEKLLSDINHVKKITGKLKAKVYVYVLPQELKIYEDVEKINLFSVNDKEKYDPEGKSKKVKPGKPGIYLE